MYQQRLNVCRSLKTFPLVTNQQVLCGARLPDLTLLNFLPPCWGVKRYRGSQGGFMLRVWTQQFYTALLKWSYVTEPLRLEASCTYFLQSTTNGPDAIALGEIIFFTYYTTMYYTTISWSSGSGYIVCDGSWAQIPTSRDHHWQK